MLHKAPGPLQNRTSLQLKRGRPFMMRSFWKCVIIAALLVCATTVQSSFLHPTKVITNCCTSVSKVPIRRSVTGFKKQNALGPCVEAVMFYLNEKTIVCSDPTADWVKNKMKGVNKKE